MLAISSEEIEFFYVPFRSYHEGVQVTLGDLDGNSLFLLFFLGVDSVIDITPLYYQQFKALYDKEPDSLTRGEFNQMVCLVHKTTLQMLSLCREQHDISCKMLGF